ncbi:MAG TPA: DnaA/Hda family protein [Gemmatimonadaceae bacterium]|nr:DnaA/Hda family protein [Gemmatimonadaceae bacterium]
MQVDSRHRFDNFIVGSANRLAVAAARAVAESPGSVYNPLFIYSGSGLGKTHLMGAIGNLAVQREATLSIEYLSLDDFVEQLHAAIGSGETELFKQRYQRVDILLIDDMQFLTGHRETQTELLRLLNAMQGGGRQIVMSSDRPPGEIADVDERLITRLSGGLIVDIGSPDYETRIAILRAKCEERGVRFWPGVVEELGRLEFSNVRELQGALNRLIAFQTLGGEQIKPENVLTVLGDLPEAKAVASRATPARAPAENEFQSFLTDVASAVAQHVQAWKVKIAEAIAYWTGEGYRTGQLERLLQESDPPANWESLLRGFGATVERLKALAQQATEVDAALGGHELFRDPERLRDAELLVDRALAGATPPPGPSAAFTRAGFEVSSSNQLAVKAADAVVAEPAERYNPLFIHGPSGVGKTHLLNAVGNELMDASGGASTVACVSAQLFMDELIAALQEGTVERWRARYRSADALLVDDVQFVAEKERTQEELFHVFNALHADGKQLVFCSDRPPRELDGFEDRLRSRFEGGLVVEMQSPDRVLREKLYARFLAATEHAAQPELLAYLAERPAASVREIIGTVNRLVAAADVSGTPLTAAVARAELEPDQAASARPSTPVAVRAAADTFFLDDEKVVWDWTDAPTRLIEELK